MMDSTEEGRAYIGLIEVSLCSADLSPRSGSTKLIDQVSKVELDASDLDRIVSYV
jgi:hypothetical protein